MSEPFDPYYQWLGIAPADQPPNYYRLVGVDLFEADVNVISNAADQRTVYLRGLQTGEHADAADQLLNEVAVARLYLLAPDRKAKYDASLLAQLQLELEEEAEEAEVDWVRLARDLERKKQVAAAAESVCAVVEIDEEEPVPEAAAVCLQQDTVAYPEPETDSRPARPCPQPAGARRQHLRPEDAGGRRSRSRRNVPVTIRGDIFPVPQLIASPLAAPMPERTPMVPYNAVPVVRSDPRVPPPPSPGQRTTQERLPEKSALDAVWLFLVVTILAVGAAAGLLLYLDRLRSTATEQARVPQPVAVAHARGVNPVHVVGERGGLPSEPAVGEGEKESQPSRIVQVEVKQPPAPVVQPTVWYRQEPAAQPVRSSAPVEHTACLIPATSVDLDWRQRPAASPYSSLDRIVYNGLGMKLVLIPPGAFLMGSGEPANVVARIPGNNSIEHFLDEHPQRLVRITQSFYLGAYEVTTGEFAQFVDETAYRTDAEKDGQGGHGYNARASNVEGRRPEYSWRNTGFPQSGKHPVVNVSWNDATAFCTWLSRREGKPYRLPTEAEWEYACRAGTGTRYYCGDDAERLVLVGNVLDAGARAVLPAWKNNVQQDDGYRFTAPVGEFEPNGFGLYDMHGNASEWCADRYSSTAYRLPSTDDPAGPSIGSCRAIRGGAWTNTAQACRSANRDGQPPDARTCSFGFRIAYTPRGW